MSSSSHGLFSLMIKVTSSLSVYVSSYFISAAVESLRRGNCISWFPLRLCKSLV